MSVHGTHSSDTSDEVHRRQVAGWRAMTPREKLDVVDALCGDVETLAIAGIRRSGATTDDAVRRELAVRRYGRRLANEVYGPPG